MSNIYYYETEQDGYCEFFTQEKARQAADEAARRDKEQVLVYDADNGGPVYIAGREYPTHNDKCMNPETYGYED